MTDRLNIILLFSDQQRADSLPCYGNSFVQTPYLDRMAQEGTVFTQCRTVFPVCTPARASMWTGLYPHSHGIERNVYGVPDLLGERGLTDRSLFALLKNAGYDLGYWGKWHLGDDNPGPFDEWHSFNSLGGHWVDHRQHFQGGTYVPDRDTDDMITWLRERDRENPFFTVLSWYPPHDPFSCPLDTMDHYRRLGVPHPGYYGSVSALDRCVGRVMAALEEQGQAENTVVFYYSDHGETFRARDGVTSKFVCTEDSVHVPFMMQGPGLPEGARCDGLIGLHDLMPTVLDLAGIAAPEELQGRSVLPLLRGEAEDWRLVNYIENETHTIMRGSEAPVLPRRRQRAVTDGRFKLILGPEGVCLHDLSNDPEERLDVSAEHTTTCDRLLEELHREALRTADDVGLDLLALVAAPIVRKSSDTRSPSPTLA